MESGVVGDPTQRWEVAAGFAVLVAEE